MLTGRLLEIQSMSCHLCGGRWREWKKDIKRRTKEKVALNQAQTRMTGSGPPQSEPLTNLEDVVQQTLVSEQVEGVSIPQSLLFKVCMVWYPVVNLNGQITAYNKLYIRYKYLNQYNFCYIFICIPPQNPDVRIFNFIFKWIASNFLHTHSFHWASDTSC